MKESKKYESDALVLHVLSGTQAGVQTELPEGRYLVGGDPSTCDLVVEGDNTNTLCLLVVETAALFFQCLAGEVHLDGKPVAQGKLHPLKHLSALSIGPVHLAVGKTSADFEAVDVPSRLGIPDSIPAARGARPRRGWAGIAAWSAGVTGAIAAGLVVAIGFAGLSNPSTSGLSMEQFSSIERNVAEQRMSEVRLEMSGTPPKVHATGYVTDRKELEELKDIIADSPSGGIVSVQRIDDLREALISRLSGESSVSVVDYAGAGRFRIKVTASEYPAISKVIEGAFRDIPALLGADLVVSDVVDLVSRSSSVVSIARLPGSTGRVSVSGDNLPMLMTSNPHRLFVEVRRGKVPSVVTRTGSRLFVGAALNDGSRIAGINDRGVVLIKQDRERIVSFAQGDGGRRFHRARRIHVAKSERP